MSNGVYQMDTIIDVAGKIRRFLNLSTKSGVFSDEHNGEKGLNTSMSIKLDLDGVTPDQLVDLATREIQRRINDKCRGMSISEGTRLEKKGTWDIKIAELITKKTTNEKAVSQTASGIESGAIDDEQMAVLEAAIARRKAQMASTN